MLDLDDLQNALKVDLIDDNSYLGKSPRDKGTRIFGGQLLAQGLVAAYRTVSNQVCHSLHGYFLRAGNVSEPVTYRVERTRDGGSFSARRLIGVQADRLLHTMDMSFHRPESGIYYQSAVMPSVSAPDELSSEFDRAEAFIKQRPMAAYRFPTGVDARWFDPQSYDAPVEKPPTRELWVRALAKIPNTNICQQAALAFISDLAFMETALRPLGRSWIDSKLQTASLDHAMWFHQPCDINDWHLYASDCPIVSSGRGLVRGNFFDSTGRLVASTAQEALLRRPTMKP